jgi:uncharacterized membrane protein
MKRQPIPDMLKGIAVLMMIQVHIMELFMRPTVYGSVAGQVSLFLGAVPAAPVFMAIMGYFAAVSKKGCGTLVWRGVKLIFWGFLLNIGLNLHLFFRIFQGLDVDPLPYLLGVDILFLAGISLIFIALTIRLLGRKLWVFALLSIAIPVLAEFTAFVHSGQDVGSYILACFISNAWWSYFPFFPWAGWVLAGFTYALLEEKYSAHPNFKRYSRYLIYFSGIPLFILIPWAVKITSNLPLYYHHGGLFFVWALFFMLLWITSIKVLYKFMAANSLMNYILWMGKNVTAMYVFQWLIIGNLATAMYRDQPGYMFWVYLPLILILSSALTYAYSRLRQKETKLY